MHISLTETLDEYVKNKVQSGLYNNASEVIREALRTQIATEDKKREQLRAALDPAIEQADRGEFADYSLETSLKKLKARTQ